MAKLTKKAKTLGTAINSEKLYGIDEAIALAKTHATSKFDETIEVAMNLGVDPRHADANRLAGALGQRDRQDGSRRRVRQGCQG
jgi:ribosomal protein L1